MSLGDVRSPFSVVGLVLAGGRSSRMGADKALLPLDGLPLVQRAADGLGPQVAMLAVSANGDPDRLAFLGLPVICDEGESAGPLSGLLVGFRWARDHCRASHVATVACDTPFFPKDLVAALLQQLTGQPTALSWPGLAVANTTHSDFSRYYTRPPSQAG